MKKLIVLVYLLLGAAACNTPTNDATNANKPTENKTTTANLSEADFTARERQVWEALQKKNYDAFAAMLASDYVEVDDNGVLDKVAGLEAVKKLSLTDVSFSDWKLLPIDQNAVVITYSATMKGTYDGQAFPQGSVRASSAWVNRAGNWLAIYHQETEVQPPPPLTTEKPAAKTAASPTTAAAPTAPTGPDPAANEKLVWDAIKSGNYDGFAALLAPDSMEIEASGVFDKTGSVKGVSMANLAKTELSDWKTVRFDNDASLVTYLVKVPGGKPEQERHSTIWVNRPGKWLALFHQGSPINAPKK
jgi:hypothetical protein